MKKMNRIGIKQILQKRQNQIKTKTQSSSIPNDDQIIQSKQIQIGHILQKIQEINVDHPIQCQLSHQQKMLLAQAISQRQSISLNLSTFCQHMIIWKVPDEMVLNQIQKKSIFKSDNSQSRNQRNYYVFKGHMQVHKRKKNTNTMHHDNLTTSKRKQSETSKQRQNQNIRFTTQAQNGILNDSGLLGSNQSFIHQKKGVVAIIEDMTGWGTLFGVRQDSNCYTLLAKNGIFAQIKNPQIEAMLLNAGGMDQNKKMQIINKFPVFKQISKKIQNIVPFIELKNYSRNDYIYHSNQKPNAVYLIIKGEIVFQVKANAIKKHSFTSNQLSRRKPLDTFLQTQKIGVGNYFGQQQILQKSEYRKNDSLCHSSQCSLLQIPIQKFEKLMVYSDFVQGLRLNASSRQQQRNAKKNKAFQIKNQFSSIQQDIQDRGQAHSSQKANDKKNFVLNKNRRKRTTQPITMHGKVIRRFPDKKQSQHDINFSMLKTNPDMYEATQKKFRKYTMKPPQKVKPQANWKLKRIWKVLNLESVLREDAQVTSPQGKFYYQSHRRLQNHVNQVKSIRPKTSSSTYRTKLQYIAYLQQFND